MSHFHEYRVTITIESNGSPSEDPEVVKLVTAESPDAALTKALALVQSENPDLNHLKAWAWNVEELNV